MTSILLVRLSSMGDLIHTFPALSDVLSHYPDVHIDWVAEEGFAELPALHPAVRNTIPMAWRRWRRALWRPAVREQMALFRLQLQQQHYDWVIDAQGLLKSAAVTLLAHGPRTGFDRRSAREGLASLVYHKGHTVACGQHAVLRNRLLLGRILGYEPEGPPVFGLQPTAALPAWLPASPFAVLLHATSREDKEWPPGQWLHLGAALQAGGLALVLPWGNAREQQRSRELAQQLPGACVPPTRLGLAQAAAVLAQARVTVGVDTGLTHLANAVGCPLVAIYTATDPGLTGVIEGPQAVNLGGRHGGPQAAEVLHCLQGWLSA